MRRRLSAVVSLAVVIVISGFVAGGAFAAPPRIPLSQAGVEQKAIFIQNLVMDSSAVQTIEESEDPDAIAALTEARLLVAGASADLANGKLKAANEGLDSALKLVNQESRRLSQTEVQGKRAEASYEKRHRTVEMFLAAYGRVAKQKQGDRFLAEVETIQALVLEAETAAERGEMTAARVLIDEAYKATRSDLRDLRNGDVLTRTLDFKNAEEEYHYEVDRNDSHFMLLAMAIEKKPPLGSFARRIEGLKDEARKSRKEADKLAVAGKHKEAIDAIGGSTRSLVKAVRMGGIFVPG